MAEIINLRRARKDKARKQAADDAAVNRAAHGRSKADRTLEKAEAGQREKTLDQAKPEP